MRTTISLTFGEDGPRMQRAGLRECEGHRCSTASTERRIDRLRRQFKDKRVLALVKSFPQGRDYVRAWRAERHYLGTPQGGILSPLLANLTLSVLAEIADER